MAQQHQTHQTPDELPRIATRQNYYSRDYIRNEKSAATSSIELLWPCASWFIVIVNAAICSMAAYDMYKNGYAWYYHYSLVIAFCLNLAILAIIYKYIINPKENNDV